MKVLLGSPFREPYDNGRMIAEALRAAGARVVQWDTRSGEPLPTTASDAAASIVLKSTLPSAAVRALPGYRVAIWPDALERNPDRHDGLRAFDRVLSCNDPGAHKWAEFFPLGWSESLMKTLPKATELSIPALFIGTNNSPERLAFVRELKLRLGASLAIYGNGWPAMLRPKPPAYYADYLAVLSKACVVVNCHESPVGPNLKCFEVPQCTVMIVDPARGVERIFAKEILPSFTFRSVDECVRLIERCNREPAFRASLKTHQWASTMPYSYEKQMARLVEEMRT